MSDTDTDIDRRLRDHGETWRAANGDRPGVDWDAVTAPRSRRAWFAVAGVSVAAAAIIVPVVLVAGGGNAPAPPVANARAGAPNGYVSLHNGEVTFVGSIGSGGIGPSHPKLESIGVSSAHQAYGAAPAPGCQTRIDRATISPKANGIGRLALSPVQTIAGGQPEAWERTAMAVSPDGSKLALVVTSRHDAFGQPFCDGSQQLVVINLLTHAVRRWVATTRDGALRSLQWAPDNRHLAFIAEYTPMVTTRIQVLDTASPGHLYDRARSVLNPNPPRDIPPTLGYGPVFWWHGQLVTTLDGSLRRLNGHGGVGTIVATGFPKEVDSVSSDPTGDHLLLIDNGKVYRWDRGVLSAVSDVLGTQPGW